MNELLRATIALGALLAALTAGATEPADDFKVAASNLLPDDLPGDPANALLGVGAYGLRARSARPRASAAS